jgi:hypothetical protein
MDLLSILSAILNIVLVWFLLEQSEQIHIYEEQSVTCKETRTQNDYLINYLKEKGYL